MLVIIQAPIVSVAGRSCQPPDPLDVVKLHVLRPLASGAVGLGRHVGNDLVVHFVARGSPCVYTYTCTCCVYIYIYIQMYTQASTYIHITHIYI